MCFADTSSRTRFETPVFTTTHRGLLCGHFLRAAAFCSCACYLYGDTSAGYCGSAASNSGTLSPTAAASGSSGACCAAPIDARHAACAFSGSACENKRAVSVCDNRVQTNVGKTGTAFLISQWAALLVRLCAQEKITQRCAGKQSKTGGISGKLRRGRGGEPYSAAAMGIL